MTLNKPGQEERGRARRCGTRWPRTFQDASPSTTASVPSWSPAPAATSAPAPTCGSHPTGVRPHQLTAMRRVTAAILALHDLPQPTIAKVPGVAVGAGLLAGAGLRSHRRVGPGPVLGDLPQARPGRRRRVVLAAAPDDRPAQGQGAGVLRRHPLGRRGRRPRAWSTGSSPTTSSTTSSTTGPPGWRPARPSPSGCRRSCSTTRCRSRMAEALEDEGRVADDHARVLRHRRGVPRLHREADARLPRPLTGTPSTMTGCRYEALAIRVRS